MNIYSINTLNALYRSVVSNLRTDLYKFVHLEFARIKPNS